MIRRLILVLVALGFFETVEAVSARGRLDDGPMTSGYVLLGIAALVIAWGFIMNIRDRFREKRAKRQQQQKKT